MDGSWQCKCKYHKPTTHASGSKTWCTRTLSSYNNNETDVIALLQLWADRAPGFKKRDRHRKEGLSREEIRTAREPEELVPGTDDSVAVASLGPAAKRAAARPKPRATQPKAVATPAAKGQASADVEASAAAPRLEIGSDQTSSSSDCSSSGSTSSSSSGSQESGH